MAFDSALTEYEKGQLRQYQDETVQYALIALLRMEGNLSAGPENLMRSKRNHLKFAIDESRLDRRLPKEALEQRHNFYRRLMGKYKWLDVNIDLTPGNPSGIAIEVKDADKLLEHFQQYKESELITVALKRSLLRLGNNPVMSAIQFETQEEYARTQSEDTLVAGTKAHLWGSAATGFLRGFKLDDVCTKHASGTEYRIGDVLKAMDGDVPIVQQEVYRIFRDMDISSSPPEMQRQRAQCKAWAADAEAGGDNNPFFHLFQVAEEIGRTAQALNSAIRKEQARERN